MARTAVSFLKFGRYTDILKVVFIGTVIGQTVVTMVTFPLSLFALAEGISAAPAMQTYLPLPMLWKHIALMPFMIVLNAAWTSLIVAAGIWIYRSLWPAKESELTGQAV